MAGEGERKRNGIPINYKAIIEEDDGPPAELVIQNTAGGMGVESDPRNESSIRGLSDKQLDERIARCKRMSRMLNLSDGGQKLVIKLNEYLEELERRNLQKEEDKCKKVAALADESTYNAQSTKKLSHFGAPPSKPASKFGSLFSSKLDNNACFKQKTTQCFGEELSTFNRSGHTSISNLSGHKRESRSFSAPITKKKGLSSRQTPFKSPSHLSDNIDNQQQTSTFDIDHLSPHPSDRDSSYCSTKKESGARSQPPLNSRRNNRKNYVLVDEEELDEDDVVIEDKVSVGQRSIEVDVVIEDNVSVGQSNKETQIYYPSRNDPEAIEIFYSDLQCLAPEKYLSSPIMNFYIRYLQMPTSPSARRKHDYHIFNTYFYEKLKQDVLTKTDRDALFHKFRRWWKGVNIFEKAYIFLPIHENLHWSLVIICIPNKEDGSGLIILHLDSLGLHNSRSIFNNVKSFLTEEWKFLKEKWKFLKEEELPDLPIAENVWNRLSRRIDEKVIEVPQQKNDYDCGIFVLFFIERFIEQAPERMKKQDSERFGRQWFKPEEASNLRIKIRKLLKKEFKSADDHTTCILDS